MKMDLLVFSVGIAEKKKLKCIYIERKQTNESDQKRSNRPRSQTIISSNPIIIIQIFAFFFFGNPKFYVMHPNFFNNLQQNFKGLTKIFETFQRKS